MKNKEKILLSLALVILLSALGSFTGGENVPSGGPPTTTDSTPVSSENVTADNVISLTPQSSSFPVHNINTGENFSTIQEAIDAPNTSDGHIIEIDSGTYSENVKVNKSLTIRSTSGDPVDTIIQANNLNDHVFEVTVDWVNISGFTVKNATEFGIAGIYLDGVAHCTISNSSVMNNGIGIALIGSSGNTIRNNLVDSNIEFGIYLESSNDNIVTNNTACSNLIYAGISLWDSSDNKITNNTANSNVWGACGIELISFSKCNNNLIDNNSANSNGGSGIIFWNTDFNVDNNTLTNNTASYNKYGGIELYGGSYNTIKNNTANSNGGPGIFLCFWTNNNTLENNTVSYNEYSGIELIYNTTHNIIKNNTARHNNGSGIALYHSTSYNTVSHNELSSNQFGLSIVSLGKTPTNNQLINNTISYSKSHGIYLLDLKQANNVTNNTVSNSNLFGILVENSSNNNIYANKANLNARGIGLVESSAIEVMDNVANSNKISGLSLTNSSANNTILNNTARFNVYEGIYLSNSSSNNISNNDVSGTQDSGSYFGISLYSSNNNDIVNNTAGSNYYFEVFQYSSTGNTIINSTVYTQTDDIRGVRMYVPETLTPSLQSVTPSTNATYNIVVENLGNLPDTFDLSISSSNDQYTVSLDKNTVSLGPGAISANTTLYEIPLRVKMNVETIKLDVSGTEPSLVRVNVEAISTNDNTVRDVIETWTIVQSSQINETTWQVNSTVINTTIMDSALIDSSITDSSVNRSAIINSTIAHSNISNSIINKSMIIGTNLSAIIMRLNASMLYLEDAIVTNGNISSGNVTIYGSPGISFVIRNEIPISKLLIGSDYRDSDLVGLIYVKTDKSLTVDGDNSDTGFDIYAENDYFAGSLSVQRSIIPPFGFKECDNNVGGYVYVNVSDNLANSTGWLIIKVFYEENELGELDENSLTLRYFDVSANRWEDVPIGGRNLEENYVWGNISHYSAFAVAGSITQKGVPPMPGGGHAPLDSDDDGLTDIQELIVGTDPDNPDTDGDSLKDGEDPFPLDQNLPLRFTPTPTHKLTPTPTPTSTPAPVTPTPSSTPIPTPKPRIPGFEAIFAIAGLLAIAYMVLRRR